MLLDIFANWFWGACQMAYKNFLNIHTLSGNEDLNLGSSWIYISSSKSPCKNALCTFIWWISQSRATAFAKKVRRIIIFATENLYSVLADDQVLLCSRASNFSCIAMHQLGSSYDFLECCGIFSCSNRCQKMNVLHIEFITSHN